MLRKHNEVLTSSTVHLTEITQQVYKKIRYTNVSTKILLNSKLPSGLSWHEGLSAGPQGAP